MNKLRVIIVISFLVTFMSNAHSQVNVGIVTGYDIYQRFVNPVDGSGTDRSSGNVMLSSAFGLKLWLGGQKVSFSAEGYGNLGILALNVEEYYGMGALSIPVLAKINFMGMSGFNPLDKFGFYVGGGNQWNKTELYGLNQRAKDRGVVRPYFQTYVVEVGLGMGSKVKVIEAFVRYGFNADNPSSALHFGVNTTYSIPNMKMPKFNVTPDKDKSDDSIFKL